MGHAISVVSIKVGPQNVVLYATIGLQATCLRPLIYSWVTEKLMGGKVGGCKFLEHPIYGGVATKWVG